MASALEDWPFEKKVKSIPTASIPVIKVEVNLESLRKIAPEFLDMENEFETLTEEQKIMHLDITFDDAEHSEASIKDEVQKIISC